MKRWMIELTRRPEGWNEDARDLLHVYAEEQEAIDALNNFASNNYCTIKKVMLLTTNPMKVVELVPELDGFKIKLVEKKVSVKFD